MTKTHSHSRRTARVMLAASVATVLLADAHADSIRIRVDGMVCTTCEPKVSRALNSLPFLAEATASTAASQACAEVSGPIDQEAIHTVLADLNYTVASIEEVATCVLEDSRYPDNWAESEGLDVAVISRGEEVDLAAHTAEGKFTIFDFGAPWCAPCHAAEKLLKDYLKDHSDVAVRAVILDAQDAKTSFAMPIVAQHLQTAPGLPYFILVNPKGKVISRSVDAAKILKKIDKKR